MVNLLPFSPLILAGEDLRSPDEAIKKQTDAIATIKVLCRNFNVTKGGHKSLFLCRLSLVLCCVHPSAFVTKDWM